MNKKRRFLIAAFTIGYAALLSLGLLCFERLLTISIVSRMFHENVYKAYPRFSAFCFIVGLLALGGLLLLFVLDGKTFVKRICWSRFFVIIGLSVPLFALWTMLLRYLQAIF